MGESRQLVTNSRQPPEETRKVDLMGELGSRQLESTSLPRSLGDSQSYLPSVFHEIGTIESHPYGEQRFTSPQVSTAKVVRAMESLTPARTHRHIDLVNNFMIAHQVHG